MCNYIFILNDDFTIEQLFLCLKPIRLQTTKIKKLLFTNNNKLMSSYIKNQKHRSFTTLQEYSNWLVWKSQSIKVINISNFMIFDGLNVSSNSELVNVGQILNWWGSICKSIKYIPIKQIQIYNFFNFTLYLLQRNHPTISKHSMDVNFSGLSPNNRLRIDISDNRCKHYPDSINYYSIRKDQQHKWKTVKPLQNHLFYKIDFKQSYLQLLCYILEIKIQGDIYRYLHGQLNIDGEFDRSHMKQHVFKILFSNQIKKYTHIQFFNKVYLFSLYLQQEHMQNEYTNTLLSQKKLKFVDNQKYSRSKLLNMFIMSLETQLYIGLLYQLFQLNKEKVVPLVFIYDSIIMSVDVDYVSQNMIEIEKILTLTNKLQISHYIGSNLSRLQEI